LHWRAKTAVGMACALLCGAAALASKPSKKARELPSTQIDAVYQNERLLSFKVEPAGAGHRDLRVGPWHFGPQLAHEKPKDGRPNLYLVFPGLQHTADGVDKFDHNNVISVIPLDGQAEFDVYWAVVLDPHMTTDLRSERALVVAAQQEFTPGDLFEFDDMPGADFLRFLGISTLGEMEQYRRHDGKLPQMIIVPAGFAVRATVGDTIEPAVSTAKTQ